MDEPCTVFWLQPEGTEAFKIVNDSANHERRRPGPNTSGHVLRIGNDHKAKIPSRLVTFGRLASNYDILLPGDSYASTGMDIDDRLLVQVPMIVP